VNTTTPTSLDIINRYIIEEKKKADRAGDIKTFAILCEIARRCQQWAMMASSLASTHEKMQRTAAKSARRRKELRSLNKTVQTQQLIISSLVRTLEVKP
jgi:hypothetical protein